MNADVRAYLARFPPDVRARLRAMRDVILAIAPTASESISYGIPTFKIDGKPLIYYAGFTRHTSLYPMTDAIRQAFAKELEGYKTSKGTIQFPLDEPMRATLLKRLVKARLAEFRAQPRSRASASSRAAKRTVRQGA